MKLLGLSTLLESLFQSKPASKSWGIKAKYHLPKSRPTTPERKRRRQRVQASKRRNRRA
ncbi:hypothetical protein KAW18_01105 [candidate division WOR-3 bacterium]|nr:hypothetical protein [candidate division WOR-3 bacterium]